MGIWSQASHIADSTPPERNRYVDFLRAASIMFVICGHWLITTAYFDRDSGTLTPIMALDIIPWTSWLTWLFQVMPIFFIVGGYSNAVSLESASKHQVSYPAWLTGRLHRLLTPLLVLVLFWVGIAFVFRLAGASAETIAFASQAALVPTWFLAIYTMIVLLAPATYALWRRFGFASLFAYILLAVVADACYFQLGWTSLGWTNYFWVWLAAHHLGFAWRDGRLASPPLLLLLSLGALATLAALIHFGPYPIAMAGSPGDEVSNTLPPKATLIALGLFQFGLLLAIEKPMQRLLASKRVWTLTVIVNTMIMTIYLWHMTILIAVLGISYLTGGIGLTVEPGSALWWWTRPLWLLFLAVLLVPVALLLSPLERQARPKDAATPSRLRLIGGAVMVGLGISIATLFGFNGSLFSLLHTGPIVLLLAGAVICGLSLPGFQTGSGLKS